MPAFLGLGPDNPVAWCNFYRKGGAKTVFGTAGAYFAIIAALIFLSSRLKPQDASSAYSAWAGLLLGLQFLFIVVIGAGRVTCLVPPIAIVRGFIASGMRRTRST